MEKVLLRICSQVFSRYRLTHSGSSSILEQGLHLCCFRTYILQHPGRRSKGRPELLLCLSRPNRPSTARNIGPHSSPMMRTETMKVKAHYAAIQRAVEYYRGWAGSLIYLCIVLLLSGLTNGKC